VADYRPDILHAWRGAALGAVSLAVGRAGRPLVVSQPLPPGPAGAILDRWLLGRADRILAGGPAEADRCRRLGVPDAKVALVPPGLNPVAGGDAGLLPGVRFLLCAGPLEPGKGFRDAIWAFDVLWRVFPDLHLVLVGSGPERQRLEQFTRVLDLGQRIYFTGNRPDLAGFLARAEVVWVPSLTETGIFVALEAMAAGRPVIASQLPGLAEVVANGVTGVLVPPGDKVALARQTRLLLDDEPRRRALGDAGRQRVRRHFAAADLVRRLAGLYRELLN
jgi:glycosyltransferase involved in cell wall biosynthesis